MYLVHAYGFPVHEVADLMAIREATVRTHLRRGLWSLRRSLKVDGTDDTSPRRHKGRDVTNGA